ncbi:hypothetical protein Tco_0162404 [Tanacetum coccineum]
MTPESIQAMIDQALLRNSTNGDGSHSSHEDNRRNVQTARPCFYADFMKCQPLNFKGTKGVVGLTRWIEKMESVFNISGCALTWWNGQIRTLGPEAYAMTWEVLKKKMTDKYCPRLTSTSVDFLTSTPGYFKRDCPKLNNKDGGNGKAQGWVYAVGNAEKRGNASGNPDANVVTDRTHFLKHLFPA